MHTKRQLQDLDRFIDVDAVIELVCNDSGVENDPLVLLTGICSEIRSSIISVCGYRI